jgi:hypothetical protein
LSPASGEAAGKKSGGVGRLTAEDFAGIIVHPSLNGLNFPIRNFRKVRAFRKEPPDHSVTVPIIPSLPAAVWGSVENVTAKGVFTVIATVIPAAFPFSSAQYGKTPF